MRSRDQSGQTLPLVLGLALLFVIGGTTLVNDVISQDPVIEQDVVQHAAYRAAIAGVDEYLFAMNANPDYVICDTANEGTGFCTNLTFSQWVPVARSSTNSPPSWFVDSDPQVNTTTGQVSMTVVGAAGYPGRIVYQVAAVQFVPLNNFLLNLYWLNYDQIDPAVLDPSDPPTCKYYWTTPVGLSSGCVAVSFVTGDSLTGSVWMNDSVFVCGSPSFVNVTTADPDNWDEATCSGSSPTVSGTKGSGVQTESIPQDDTVLASVAARDGCLYEGPTTLTLDGSTMDVTSPDTPTGPPPNGSSPANDALLDAANTNVCMPSSAGGSVSLPTNGVVFVENCLSSDASCIESFRNPDPYNPMSGYDETGSSGPTYGDAIVQGTVTGPLTVAAQNNVVIDGNLCYTSTGNCAEAPASPATDVLGLIAYNYVEVNHPVTESRGNYSDLATCGSRGAGSAPGCDLSSPDIDAVILALNHSFLVNEYSEGATLGTLTVNGAIDQNWRGPVGTDNDGAVVTGYSKNYQYDSRLHYLSPPYYLSPGTSSWGLASIYASPGATCVLPDDQACPAVP
jgi:hypothetical protein